MSREEEKKERQLRRELRRIQRKRQERIRQILLGSLLGVSALIVVAAAIVLWNNIFQKEPVKPSEVEVPEYVEVNLLTPNPYSRPQKP